MDSNLLKVFVAVANKQSISLGAQELGYAQSNVTSRIKQLEKSIGQVLFHRVPKGVILTQEGEKLFKHAIEIVRKVEDAILDMQNIQEQKKLIVGSTDCNAAVRISPFLVKLHEDYPNTQLELLTGRLSRCILLYESLARSLHKLRYNQQTISAFYAIPAYPYPI